MSDNNLIALDDARSEPDPEAVAELEAIFDASRPEGPGEDFFAAMTDAVMAEVASDAPPVTEDAPPRVIDLAAERERRRPPARVILSAIAAALLIGLLAWWAWPAGDNPGTTPAPGDHTPSVAQDDTPPEKSDVETEGTSLASDDEPEDWRALEADSLEAFAETLNDEPIDVSLEEMELPDADGEDAAGLAALDEMEVAELEALDSVLASELDTL